MIVLLVEDNADHAELTMDALQSDDDGIRVVWRRDAEAAWRFLLGEKSTDMAPAPDIILLDINLPGMSGKQLLRRLKGATATRRIPVVMLTTSHHAGEIAECFDYGANGYIVKSVNYDSFYDKLSTFKRYWMQVSELPCAVDEIPAADEDTIDPVMTGGLRREQ